MRRFDILLGNFLNHFTCVKGIALTEDELVGHLAAIYLVSIYSASGKAALEYS